MGKRFKPFEEARDFACSLKLKNMVEWKEFCKSGKRPDDIPVHPQRVYEKEWNGKKDWLGIGFRSFEEARRFVRNLGLKGSTEWREYCKSEKRATFIPRSPEGVYKDKGWIDMKDWLGIGYRQFEESRKFVRNLGLKNRDEWLEYCSSGRKPDDIPAAAYLIYKDKGWIGMKDWLGTKWRPFREAREFARKLGLESSSEWREYCKSGKKPDDIPPSPAQAYKKEWENMTNWLGAELRPFEEVRGFARKLGLKSGRGWMKYYKSGKRPGSAIVYSVKAANALIRNGSIVYLTGVPRSPEYAYKGKGWKGWGDFLGTGNVANQNKKFRPFREAREFVRSLKLKNRKEWQEFCKSDKNPDDIPSAPQKVYKKEWMGMEDWLNVKFILEFKPFGDAREVVHQLHVGSVREWKKYCKSGKKPKDIPSGPEIVYKKEWKSWGDWLGTGTKRPGYVKHRKFREAKEFVCSLKLKNLVEWKEYCKSGKKPEDIPSGPNRVYEKEWKSWGDFMGTGTIRPRDIKFKPFEEAREFVRSLGLERSKGWREYCKTGKPDDIPANPDQVYKKEWEGWGDFVGTEWRPFREAREFARKLGFKGSTEWREYVKSDRKPEDIPSGPDTVYKKEWKGMGDFLGTGTIAHQDRNILSYNEAEKLAWKICKKLKINTPTEWENAHRAGKIQKNLPVSPQLYYQIKRGIAKNVENEFYTSWFKFSGTSSKWTEEMSQYTIKELAREINDPNLLLDTFLLLHTDYVLKNGKHKAKFADMITRITKGELELDQIDFRGKVCTTIILFYIVNYIYSDSEAYSDL